MNRDSCQWATCPWRDSPSELPERPTSPSRTWGSCRKKRWTHIYRCPYWTNPKHWTDPKTRRRRSAAVGEKKCTLFMPTVLWIYVDAPAVHGTSFFRVLQCAKLQNSYSIVACPDCHQTFARLWNQKEHWDRHHGPPRQRGEHRYDLRPLFWYSKISCSVLCNYPGCATKFFEKNRSTHMKDVHDKDYCEWNPWRFICCWLQDCFGVTYMVS